MPADPAHCCGMAWRRERLNCGRCGKRLLVPVRIQPLRIVTKGRPFSQFAVDLREVMTQRGISRKQLAVLTGMNKSQLCRYERGINRPRPEQIARIKAALGIDQAPLTEERTLVHAG